MRNDETLLAELLERCAGRRGIEYLAATRALKRYLNETADNQFRFDVGRIVDRANFGHLIAAGLTIAQQHILAEYQEVK